MSPAEANSLVPSCFTPAVCNPDQSFGLGSWKDVSLGNGVCPATGSVAAGFLFIIGFFLIAIPWSLGLLILMCGRSVDYRKKPGWIACTFAAILGTIAIIIEATERTHRW